jgi:hypothetical protein
LGFHVDYWDYIGWRDQFATREFSQRQADYVRNLGLASSYTPQMVVDGRSEFSASNSAKATDAIGKAASIQKALVEVKLNGKSLNVNINDIPEHQNLTVYLAIAESGLATQVKAGENRGSELRHSSVVRQLKSLGNVANGATNYLTKLEIEIERGWKIENLSYVVFIQEDESRMILGVGQVAGTGR